MKILFAPSKSIHAARLAEALKGFGHEIWTVPDFDVEYDVAVSVDLPDTYKAKKKILWLLSPFFDPNCRWLGDYSAIVCPSDWYRDELMKFYECVPREKFVTIWTGMDLSPLRSEWKKVGSRIVYSMEPGEALDRMLTLFPAVREQSPDAELVVVKGPEDVNMGPFARAQVEYLSAVAATTEGVSVVENDRLIPELMVGKVWAHPSSFSFKDISCEHAVMAMASGCVPVVANEASMGEIVRTGCGIKLREMGLPRMDDAFVWNVSSLLNDEYYRMGFDYQGREWAVENWGVKIWARRWMNLFTALESPPLTLHPNRFQPLSFYEEPKPEENVLDTVIVVLTCVRPEKASYLNETLKDITREGGLSKGVTRVLLFDGGAHTETIEPWLLNHWQVAQVDAGTRRGNVQAMWTAAGMAEKLKARRVVVFEDDVRLCKNAVLRILSIEVPDNMAMVSFFDPEHVVPGAPPGLTTIKARAYSCNQAFMLPRRTSRWVSLSDYKNGSWHDGNGDDFLARTMGRSPWPIVGIHTPNLVEHVGEVSAVYLGNGLVKGRVARNFPGVEFDALTLTF